MTYEYVEIRNGENILLTRSLLTMELKRNGFRQADLTSYIDKLDHGYVVSAETGAQFVRYIGQFGQREAR